VQAIISILVTGKSSKPELGATVPQSDTGGLVEYTKVYELSHAKELGNLPSYLRYKTALPNAGLEYLAF
jgi:hypothetical protein